MLFNQLDSIFTPYYEKILEKNNLYLNINITQPDEIKTILDNISEKDFNRMINSEVMLLLNNQFESFKEVPDFIYEYMIDKHNIIEQNIVLISGAANIKSLVEDARKKYNHNNNKNFKTFKSYWICAGEKLISSYLKKSQYGISLKTKLKLSGKFLPKKRFICLNNRWRPHRPALISLLYCKKLETFGYLSLGNNEISKTWNDILPEILELHKNHFDSFSLLYNNYEKILSIPELMIDCVRYQDKTIGMSRGLDTFYDNSAFSVVTETNFYGYDVPFLSEKTFKAIAYLHPFVLVSNPNSLDLLKNMGYKTFHPYIDESYDKEQNDCERFWMILNEIERLALLSEEEMKDFCRKVSHICYHNYQHLCKR